MSCLNRSESQTLRDAEVLLLNIQTHGFDIEAAKEGAAHPSRASDHQRLQARMARDIHLMQRRLRTLVIVKGYTPKS